MPADEVTHGTDVDESRVRTGPRHAAPKKPLFTRFHMPAGKAIATVAMPTAVLMGMGFTSSLALADSGGGSATTNSQKADEYKDCVTAVDGSTASPSPSASASSGDTADKATPSPSSSTGTSKDSSDTTSGKTGSSDSGSDDKATPTPSASESSGKGTSGGDTATPSPSASASSGGGLLDGIGDALGGLLGGGSDSSTSSASPTPTPSASASTSKDSASSGSSGTSASDTVKEATEKATDTVGKTVKDTTDTATKAAEEATKAAQTAAESATSASPSPSSSTDAANCEAATDDTGGVDNKVPVADAPWYLNASSLTLNKADYQGIVKVRTANGTVKKVLKYVISGGTDIGDLHQMVKDTDINKTYHVQAAKGSHSTITGGTTTMYTESISGNLFGLIPLTFTPDSPPPLNIPFIYFTNVKVVQAAQFGGTLHVPGMHLYTTDGTG
ncbi:hypothetical protein [Streptomyces sp. NPDC001492]